MTNQRTTSYYGWQPDLPDFRDQKISARDMQLHAQINTRPLPPKVDLSDRCPPIIDQGMLGSCTACAAVAAYYAASPKMKSPGSPLFIYYWERFLQNSVRFDSGASIRDAVKTLAKYGCPPEAGWPYDITRFKLKPPSSIVNEALRHQALQYTRVEQTALGLKSALAAGHTVLFGFTVYTAFESAGVAATGYMNVPKPDETILGGHAVLLVGYDDTNNTSPSDTGIFKIRNSWGTDWGAQGHFYMPGAYLLNPALASDFWIVTVTEG